MYRKEKPLLLKGSTSALANNLSIEVNLEKGIISYATVHKSLVNLVSASLDGTSVNPRQIPCKEPSAAQGFTMILQVNSCQDSSRQCRLLHVNAHNKAVVLLPFNCRPARLEKNTKTATFLGRDYSQSSSANKVTFATIRRAVTSLLCKFWNHCQYSQSSGVVTLTFFRSL